jgi:hypothetical protein
MFWFSPIFALLVLIPAVRLLRRGGHSPWSALLLLIPVVNVGFIWWLAFGQGAQRAGGNGNTCNRSNRRHAEPKTTRKQDGDDVIEMPGSAA